MEITKMQVLPEMFGMVTDVNVTPMTDEIRAAIEVGKGLMPGLDSGLRYVFIMAAEVDRDQEIVVPLAVTEHTMDEIVGAIIAASGDRWSQRLSRAVKLAARFNDLNAVHGTRLRFEDEDERG